LQRWSRAAEPTCRESLGYAGLSFERPFIAGKLRCDEQDMMGAAVEDDLQPPRPGHQPGLRSAGCRCLALPGLTRRRAAFVAIDAGGSGKADAKHWHG